MRKKKIEQAFCLRPERPTDVVNELSVRRVLGTVDVGLVNGVGVAVPGQMCVEAAVAYAFGYDHNDSPRCVADAVASFKICLNDDNWSSNRARARGLRAIAIAQLGTAGVGKKAVKVDEDAFLQACVAVVTRRLVNKLAETYALPSTTKRRELIARTKELLHSVFNHEENADTAYSFLEDMVPGNYELKLQRLLGSKGGKLNRRLRLMADIGTEALVYLKTPGSKFLYLLDEVPAGSIKARK